MDLGWDIDPTVFNDLLSDQFGANDIPDWLSALGEYDPFSGLPGSFDGGGEGDSDMPGWFDWFSPGTTGGDGSGVEDPGMVEFFGTQIPDFSNDGDNFDETALLAFMYGTSLALAGEEAGAASFFIIAAWAAYADSNIG